MNIRQPRVSNRLGDAQLGFVVPANLPSPVLVLAYRHTIPHQPEGVGIGVPLLLPQPVGAGSIEAAGSICGRGVDGLSGYRPSRDESHDRDDHGATYADQSSDLAGVHAGHRSASGAMPAASRTE